MKTPVISDREVFYVAEGFDRLDENGTIVLICKSIDKDKNFCEKYGINIPKKNNKVRIDFKYFVFEIKIINEKRCFLKAIVNTDPHVSITPKSVVNWMAKKVFYYYYIYIYL